MIKFKFNNPNSRTLTTIEIYREDYDAAVPDPTVNPPLATLDGFATEYTDLTTELGKDYKYYFRVLRQGGQSILSEPVILGDVSKYGSGEFSITTSASNSIWGFGVVADSMLPSVADIAGYTGSGTVFKSWTGQWSKFKVGSDIYFTPYKGYIQFTAANLSEFMTKVANAGQFRLGYMTYEFAKLPIITTMEVLDGLMPVTWNLEKENPRKSILDSATGLSYSEQSSSRVITSVASATTGTMFKPNPSSEYLASSSDSINLATAEQFVWYWKPIIKFIPQPVRNFG